MITGIVNELQARVKLKVRGPRRRQMTVDAVVDMGYTGMLVLPSEIVAELNLPLENLGTGTLADGSVCMFGVYQATVVWDGKPLMIHVDETHGAPLVGMALMEGHELNAQIREGGKVWLKKLQAKAKKR